MQNTCPYTSLQLPVTQEMTTQQLFLPVDSPVDISLPIAPRNPRFAELPSSDINRAKLKNIHDVLQKYSTLRVESKIGILAVKLAREAIFGNDIPKQCTPEDGTTCQLFHRWSWTTWRLLCLGNFHAFGLAQSNLKTFGQLLRSHWLKHAKGWESHNRYNSLGLLFLWLLLLLFLFASITIIYYYNTIIVLCKSHFIG